MLLRRTGFTLFLLLAVSWICPAQEMPEGRLMRFPDVSKDRIVFSYAGDLWLVPRTGGDARRITTHPGLELFPKFSPLYRKISHSWVETSFLLARRAELAR